MSYAPTPLDEQVITTIRMLAVDAVEKAKSGHPGLPLGAAPMAYALWRHFYTHDPGDPQWLNRDRFILSAGHGSMLQYALLHLSGYEVSLDDLKQFRQYGSITPGHPEVGHTPGVETTTGPLGQGFATGVGMAMAERFLGQVYNTPDHTVIDYRTYGIVSDGDLMEGVASEAASIAGNLKLGKLIYLYDSNRITIEGSTDLAFTEDVGKRFEAYGWHVLNVTDGNNVEEVAHAIANAKEETERPSLIIVHTHIGYGSPKQDSESVHGSPLGEEARKATRAFYQWPEEEFRVPDEVYAHMRDGQARGAEARSVWRERFAGYEAAHPDKAHELQLLARGELPEGWDKDLPVFTSEVGTMATRSASENVMQILAQNIPTFMGGSADLGSSNKTILKDKGAWTGLSQEEAGYNQHYGVREHGMAAITNGLALSRAIIPYAATFFIFTDYMRGAMRLSALMGVRAIYVLTHDSIGQGEDGATHQPIEHLASFRAMPNIHVIRPADANETREAWRAAVTRADGPTLLVLTRQDIPILDRARYASAEGVLRGAYTLNPEVNDPAAIIMATGSEVSVALEASERLKEEGIVARVVSMPSWELFEMQSSEYRESVLPERVQARVVVEAGSSFGWERYVGRKGGFVTIDRFGASAPGDVMMREYDITPEVVMDAVRAQIASTH